MEKETPKNLIFGLLAVMLEEATGIKPDNPEYNRFWETLENDAQSFVSHNSFNEETQI